MSATEPLPHVTQLPSLRIESSAADLRIVAAPKSRTKLVLIGLLTLGLSALPLAYAVQSLLHRMSRPNAKLEAEWTAVAATSAILLLAIVVLIVAALRYLRPSVVTVALGQVTVDLPEQTPRWREFPLAQLLGAELRASVAQPHLATLVLRRRGGATVTALIGYPALELTKAVDEINQRVLSDHHNAFEVVVGDAPAGAVPAIPVFSEPLRVLPVEDERT